MTEQPGLRAVQHWLARQPTGIELELCCAEHPEPARGERGATVVRLIGCAGAVAPEELVELLTLGAEHVTVRLDGCADAAAAREHLSPVVELLRAGGVTRLALATDVVGRAQRRRPVLDAAAMPVSRRQLFGMATGASRELPGPDATAHDRLVSAVRELAEPSNALDAIEGPALRLTARGCTACGVCVQACPAQALTLAHGVGGAGLSITTLLQSPSGCDGCQLCVELCPTHVLATAGNLPWGDLLTDSPAAIATVTTARCARCSTPFPVSTGERYCAVCAYRRLHPFGSAAPPVGRPPAAPLP